MVVKVLSLLSLYVIGTVIANNNNLRCYSCGFSSTDTDQSCLTITDTTNSIACPHQYCTIMRQEFVDPPGTVSSFVRGCEQSPPFLNHDIVDFTYRTFYRACTSNLCNIGDGIQSIVGGNLSPTRPFEGENLLVPGTGGSFTTRNSLFTISITLLVITIYNV